MRYLTGGAPIPRESIETEVLPAYLAWHRNTPQFGYWAVQTAASDEFLGWFHLRPSLAMPKDQELELGYRLMRSAWGRGYATEGSLALVAHAFETLGACRVTATTMAVNQASRRVMEKAGLTYRRTYHRHWDNPIPGIEHGEVEYAISKEEWVSGFCD